MPNMNSATLHSQLQSCQITNGSVPLAYVKSDDKNTNLHMKTITFERTNGILSTLSNNNVGKREFSLPTLTNFKVTNGSIQAAGEMDRGKCPGLRSETESLQETNGLGSAVQNKKVDHSNHSLTAPLSLQVANGNIEAIEERNVLKCPGLSAKTKSFQGTNGHLSGIQNKNADKRKLSLAESLSSGVANSNIQAATKSSVDKSPEIKSLQKTNGDVLAFQHKHVDKCMNSQLLNTSRLHVANDNILAVQEKCVDRSPVLPANTKRLYSINGPVSVTQDRNVAECNRSMLPKTLRFAVADGDALAVQERGPDGSAAVSYARGTLTGLHVTNLAFGACSDEAEVSRPRRIIFRATAKDQPAIYKRSVLDMLELPHPRVRSYCCQLALFAGTLVLAAGALLVCVEADLVGSGIRKAIDSRARRQDTFHQEVVDFSLKAGLVLLFTGLALTSFSALVLLQKYEFTYEVYRKPILLYLCF